MAPKLYASDTSPAVRAVLLTAKALGLELEIVPVNLMAGEHLKPEYLKMNPQHTIPTLNDNGYILWDSHAICAYLAAKYGKNDSLYPQDLQKRGLVDQRLHYNSGVIQARFGAIVRPIIREGVTTISAGNLDLIQQTYDTLNTLLESKNYFAGDSLTIADFAIASTISSVNGIIPIDKSKYQKLSAWLGRLEALPYYKEANQAGADKLVGFIKSKLT